MHIKHARWRAQEEAQDTDKPTRVKKSQKNRAICEGKCHVCLWIFLKFELSQLNSMMRPWKIAENVLLTALKHPTKVISV